MADQDLLNEFEDREIQTMSLFLRTKAAKTAITIEEFIEARLLQGADPNEIKNLLIDDLRNNGRIFSEFRSAIKSTARGSVNRIRDAGQYAEFGIERNYRWSAILVKTCRDCLNNHGDINTWEGWQRSRFGLPRSGGTVCRENCHCVLLPSESTALQPIRRKPRSK